MISQNSLDSAISHIACYFCSIANAAGRDWSAKELNSIFFVDKQAGLIDKSNCIYSPTGVARSLGEKIKFRMKAYPDSYSPKAGDYVIGCWKMTPDAADAHFVVMDNSGIFTKEHVTYDPWEGGSKTVREGICTSLRIFNEQT